MVLLHSSRFDRSFGYRMFVHSVFSTKGHKEKIMPALEDIDHLQTQYCYKCNIKLTAGLFDLKEPDMFEKLSRMGIRVRLACPPCFEIIQKEEKENAQINSQHIDTGNK